MSQNTTQKTTGAVRRPDAELRRLALDICDGQVYHSGMTTSREELTSVFMVLTFLSVEALEKMQANCSLVYEYYKEAGPLACNGKPIFFSCGLIHIDDHAALSEHIRVIQAFRAGFVEEAVPLPALIP